MPSRVLITVDTELTWGPYARGASWQENLACSYDPAGVGVPYQLEVLSSHGLKACFFVDPMPALVYGLEPVRRMVEPILAAGQEVQLHIHPVWLSIAEGKAEGADFELTCFDADTQQALIAKAADLLVEAGAPRPIAFRSGSFAADRNTLGALRKLGISYDSSHNGSEHPSPSNLPLPAAHIAPVALDGVVEVPVSQIEAAAGSLRPLQLCAVSTRELREALLHASVNDHPTTTIVSHSFELASRDGLRPNRTVRSRFEALCAFLAEHRESLPTVHFTDLADLPLGRPASPLPARRLRTTARMVQQLWSNAVYERRL
jgi:peptidoglycan/xylan/chitin deacetylase (PgdA/CDA1 family)